MKSEDVTDARAVMQPMVARTPGGIFAADGSDSLTNHDQRRQMVEHTIYQMILEQQQPQPKTCEKLCTKTKMICLALITAILLGVVGFCIQLAREFGTDQDFASSFADEIQTKLLSALRGESENCDSEIRNQTTPV
jgi:uncharacterized protein HemX